MERSAPSGHLPPTHRPVLYAQVLDGLAVRAGGTYLDGTFGRGGHARGVLERLGPDGRLLLMDKDPEAIAVAREAFGADARVAIHHGSFADLAHWEAAAGGLDGVLLDLGVSSPQIDVAERGFSFGKDGPLDMRMDPTAGLSVAQWLDSAEEREIADVLWTYGEERASRRIAKAIVARRATTPLARTGELADLIGAVVPRGKDKSNPATRSFQALRIFINRELADLEAGLDAAHARLNVGGRLAVISFHSLEDRIVKQFMARHAKAPPADRRRPVEPEFTATLTLVGGAQKADASELADNVRSRSAVLRVAEKLGTGDRGPGTGDGWSTTDAGNTLGQDATAPASRPVPTPGPLTSPVPGPRSPVADDGAHP